MRQLKITKQVTNRETASLDKYLQEIGKVDLISAEEDSQGCQQQQEPVCYNDHSDLNIRKPHHDFGLAKR